MVEPGWQRIGPDPAILAWAKAAQAAARTALATSPEPWRCGGTWFVGVDALPNGPDGAIGRMVASGKLSSMILWGPPGTGKTTIARLLADAVGMRFAAVSARQPELHLRADRKVAYEKVADVMAAAQRANIVKIAFLTDPAR